MPRLSADEPEAVWYKGRVHGLYAIVDLPLCAGRSPREIAAALCEGGASVVQIRAKGVGAEAFLAAAREVRAVTRERGVPMLVNDRLDVALLSDADGVHLGQSDLPVAVARRLLPPGSLIGLSTHSLAQVDAAVSSGADYLGFGPVFSTSTKPDAEPVQGLEGLAAACRASPLPVVAIGGIRLDRVPAIRRAGAAAAAVISDLLCAHDLVARARAYREAWG